MLIIIYITVSFLINQYKAVTTAHIIVNIKELEFNIAVEYLFIKFTLNVN